MARASCVAIIRANTEHITRPLDGLRSLVPLSVCVTDIFRKLKADIIERVNLLHFANLAPMFPNRARPESMRFASRLGHGALEFLTSDPLTTGRLSELPDKFPRQYDAAFRVAVCRTFGLRSPRILSTLRSPVACVFCHLSVHAMRRAFESA
jgi:hypothetical protein